MVYVSLCALYRWQWFVLTNTLWRQSRFEDEKTVKRLAGLWLTEPKSTIIAPTRKLKTTKKDEPGPKQKTPKTSESKTTIDKIYNQDNSEQVISPYRHCMSLWVWQLMRKFRVMGIKDMRVHTKGKKFTLNQAWIKWCEFLIACLENDSSVNFYDLK